jgi:fructose-1,6-bisphosphatase
MFPKATSGTDSNNRKFSKCSRDYIAPVLQTKADNCLKREYEYMYGGAWWCMVFRFMVVCSSDAGCVGTVLLVLGIRV